MKKVFAVLMGIMFAGIVSGQTFTNSTPVAIPDNDILVGALSNITVSGIPPIATLTNVTLNITHTYDSDLEVYIVDPLGNEHLLFDNVGGSGDNFTNTQFTNTAGTSITLGSAPFTGIFLAQSGTLPTGVNPNDVWSIHAYDWAAGDLGIIQSWSITFSAPSCPTVNFHADGFPASTVPASVACNAATFNLYANDSADAHGAIYPTLYFEFNTHANGTLNGCTIYEDGVSIYTDPSLDINTQLTVYAVGPFMGPTYNYTIQVCNNGGTAPMEWVVYDGNGFTNASGTTPSGCTNYGPWHPMGLSSWSVVPAAGGFLSTDWGAAQFNPASAGPGSYQITYSWNNQSPIPGYVCTGSGSHTLVVTNPWSAAWTSPGTICASSGSVNLNGYITGNSGGTWSGTGVSGASFNPSGLSGNISITYTVGSGGTCQATSTQNINVTPLATSNAGPNASRCAGSTFTVSGAAYGGSATGVLWTTSGSGSFTGANTTTPTYTPSPADITAGTVTLTMTASGPCASASDNMVLTITPLDNATFNYSSGTFCQTGPNPTPTISLPGGTFTFSPGGLSINASTGTINLAGSTTGITYTVTYTTNGTCPNSSSTTVLITTGFDASFSYSGPYCQYTSNPSPTFTTGSAGTFTSTPAGLIFVSTSTGVIDLASSAPGTYLVTNTIAGAGGCSAASSNFSVTIEQAAVVSAGSDANVCAGTAYSLAGSMAGMAGSITWTTSGDGVFSNASSTTSTYTPGAADAIVGTVTLTITSNDPAGSCGPVSDNMTLTVFAPAVVSAGSDVSICSNDTYTLNGTMSGSAASVNWSSSGTGSFSDVTSLTSTYTPSAADITAGSVTLTLTSNDPAGPCNVAADVVVITITPAATANAGSDMAVCAGTDASVVATIGGGATSSSWSTGGTGTFANASNLSTTYTPSAADIAAGTVTLTITTNDPAGSCNAVNDQLVLTINPTPVIDSVIVSDVTTCSTPNGSITIYAHGGTGVLLYAIDGGTVYTATTVYSSLGVGNYNIVVQDGNLCESTDLAVIATASGIGPDISTVDVTDVACFGATTGAITIHADNAVLFSIDNGGTLVTDSVFTGLAAGVYDIIVEDAGSCQDVAQVTIDENPEIHVDSTVTNVGCGTIGSALVTVSGGVSPYTYDWSHDAANHTNSATNLSGANYTVTVTDNAGCTETILITVGNTGGTGIGLISDTTDVSCYGLTDGSATVAMTNGVAPYTYVWSNNPSNNTPTASSLIAGSYQVTISDVSGCSVVLTINISQPVILVGSASTNDITCFGQNNGIAVASANGGTPPYSYHWSNGLLTATATGLSQGVYTVTVTDSKNCTDTVINVTINQPAELIALVTSQNASCANGNDGQAIVTVTGGTAPYTYNWSNGSVNDTISALTDTSYIVSVTDVHFCSDVVVTTIYSPTSMVVVATTGITATTHDGYINLSITGGNLPYIFVWSNGQTSQNVQGLVAGDYIVTITDANDCAIIDTFSVDVPLIIPDVITPNADGVNDDFEITNIDAYPEVTIEIFSRWGDLLFKFDGTGMEYKDPANRWDGTRNEKELPMGSYMYIINLHNDDEPVTGAISVIR